MEIPENIAVLGVCQAGGLSAPIITHWREKEEQEEEEEKGGKEVRIPEEGIEKLGIGGLLEKQEETDRGDGEHMISSFSSFFCLISILK